MEYFRTGEVMKAGWEKFKAHKFFLWMLIGIIVISQVLFGSLERATRETDVLGVVVSLGTFLLTTYLAVGFTKLVLEMVDHDTEGKLGTLFHFQKIYWPYLGASILFCILLGLGFLLLLIPGIYFGLKYQFYGQLMVDKQLGVREAFRKSGEITDGVKWQLFGFSWVIVGFNLLGVLALGVGLLVTIPVTAVAYTVVYRKLVARLGNTSILNVPVTPVTPVAPVIPAQAPDSNIAR